MRGFKTLCALVIIAVGVSYIAARDVYSGMMGPPLDPPFNSVACHEVQKGDTLWELAERLTGNAEKLTGKYKNYQILQRYNNIEDPTKLQVGTTLYVPTTRDSFLYGVSPFNEDKCEIAQAKKASAEMHKITDAPR